MDPILFWNDIAVEVHRRDFVGIPEISPQQGGPTRTSRALAIVHVAMYDAWNGAKATGNNYLGVGGHLLVIVGVCAIFRLTRKRVIYRHPISKGLICTAVGNSADDYSVLVAGMLAKEVRHVRVGQGCPITGKRDIRHKGTS